MKNNYSTVQFTSEDISKIKLAQNYLAQKLGLRLSLAQTVIYAINKVEMNAHIEKMAAQFEAMKANLQAATEAQAYYSAHPEAKPKTLGDILNNKKFN